jgi:hypothetical protein
VRSPMLFSVGMYLPLETTFAIFVGGVLRGIVDKRAEKRGYNAAQKARVENAGVLTASGLIAGEALMGLVAAGVVAYQAWGAAPGTEIGFPQITSMMPVFGDLAPWLAIPMMIGLGLYLVYRPLGKAGAPDEPAPPTAVM